MITSYSFGRIEVDNQGFTKDLIILHDGSIHHPWWRKSGHRLTLADLGPVLNQPPKILVVGTGSPGLMKPDTTLVSELSEKGIAVRIMPTKKAVVAYNALLAKGELVTACLHLTC